MAKEQSQGTIIKVSTALDTPVYTEIKTPKTIGGIDDGDPSEIDVTDLSSVAKEFRLGLTDSGSLTMDFDWNPTDPGQIIIQTAVDQVIKPVLMSEITFPSGKKFTFQFLPKKFSKSVGLDEMVKATMDFRITGPIARS